MDNKTIITEATLPNKSIADVTDAEFDNIIDGLLDIVNEIDKEPFADIEDQDSRVNKINKKAKDKIATQELSREDQKNKKAELDKYKAQEDEINKYRADHCATIADFEDDLFRAIKNQVATRDEKEDSWSALNRRHDGSDGILRPGEITDEIKRFEAVKIRVYLDCSASFTEADIIKERTFMSVLADYVNKGKVKVDIVYFADNLHPTFKQARAEGGTGAWLDIVKDIQEQQPDNVLIITDCDMNPAALYNSDHYTVPGIVWYIWKITKAPELLKRINGYQGTEEYNLS